MRIGIDQSKRSTAVVTVTDTGSLVAYELICAPKEIDNEELIVYQLDRLLKVVDAAINYENLLPDIFIEGLSFGSVSSSKDILAGLLWYIKTRLYVLYPDIKVTTVPVTSWRAKVIPIEERREIKRLNLKDGLKKATVAKLPFEVKVILEDYIINRSLKPSSIYDLADAHFLALHGLTDNK